MLFPSTAAYSPDSIYAPIFPNGAEAIFKAILKASDSSECVRTPQGQSSQCRGEQLLVTNLSSGGHGFLSNPEAARALWEMSVASHNVPVSGDLEHVGQPLWSQIQGWPVFGCAE